MHTDAHEEFSYDASMQACLSIPFRISVYDTVKDRACASMLQITPVKARRKRGKQAEV